MKLKIILSTCLLILFVGLLSAQSDKTYLNAMVKSDLGSLMVSIEGQPYQLVHLDKACIKTFGETQSCILEYIGKMKESGWEIISSQMEGSSFYFFLRKKKDADSK